MTAIPLDLIAAGNMVYTPAGFTWSTPLIEKESAEYGACTFRLNDLSILFRVAKITPTKIGQFVTLWKRTGQSPIQPFDLSDPFDFCVISAKKDDCLGQFIFPKSVLHDKGIVSKDGKGGKRAIRVYPAWDNPTSDQARKTQAWQLQYFLEIQENAPIDFSWVKQLYQSAIA